MKRNIALASVTRCAAQMLKEWRNMDENDFSFSAQFHRVGEIERVAFCLMSGKTTLTLDLPLNHLKEIKPRGWFSSLRAVAGLATESYAWTEAPYFKYEIVLKEASREVIVREYRE